MRLPVSTSKIIDCDGPRFTQPWASSFSRHGQIYHPVRTVLGAWAQQYSAPPAPPHRLDESAAGYSLASCSPAELASASPADFIFVRLAEFVNRPTSRRFHVSLCAGVIADVVRNAGRPHFPKNTDPGTGQDAHSVWMPAAARSGRSVNMRGPRGTAARVIGPKRDGDTQSMIASPAKRHATRFAALPGYRSDARLGGKLLGGGEALTDISDLGEDLGRSKMACIGEAHQQYPIVKLFDLRFDARGKNGDLFLQGRDDTRQCEYKLSTGPFFQRASQSHRGSTQTSQKFGGRLAAAISVPFQKSGEALFSKMRGTAGRGVFLQKSQCDRGVDLIEQPGRARPKARQQGLQLIAQDQSLLDQIVARTHQRAQGFRRVRRRHQRPEAMTVRAQHIRQQVGVPQVVLTACRAVAWTARLDCIRMDRYDRMTEGHQSIDDQSRWPFNGNGNRRGGSDPLQLFSEGLQTVCIVAYFRSQHGLSCLVYHTNCMGSSAPIQPREIFHSRPRIDGLFRIRRSGGLLTNRRSWDMPMARLPVACRDFPHPPCRRSHRGHQRLVSMAIMASERKRDNRTVIQSSFSIGE